MKIQVKRDQDEQGWRFHINDQSGFSIDAVCMRSNSSVQDIPLPVLFVKPCTELARMG